MHMGTPILLYDTITNESAKEITRQILESNTDEAVELWIDSPGGSVTSGWSIIAAMQQREVNITVTGDASSMAFIMLAFANNVKIFDTTNGLLHRAASWWEEVMDENELKDIDNRNKVIRKKLEAKIDIEAFENITKKTFDDVFTMDDRLDVRLNANQMKNIGLVDEVIKIDVKKKKEIESNYYSQIAALAENKTKTINNNSNKNKMGKLSDLIFGEKDALLVAEIDGKQFAYSKLEKGAKVKPVGEGVEAVSGNFETNDNKVSIVENEITNIEAIDNKQKEIDSLKAELKELKENQLTAEDVAEVFNKFQEKQAEKLDSIEAILDKAKLSVSKPEIPQGEMKEDNVIDALTAKQKFKNKRKGTK